MEAAVGDERPRRHRGRDHSYAKTMPRTEACILCGEPSTVAAHVTMKHGDRFAWPENSGLCEPCATLIRTRDVAEVIRLTVRQGFDTASAAGAAQVLLARCDLPASKP